MEVAVMEVAVVEVVVWCGDCWFVGVWNGSEVF